MTYITPRRVGQAASLVAVTGLLAATLWPLAEAPQAGHSFCFFCGAVGGADFAANLIAFVPLGVALTFALGSAGRATLFTLGLTVLIELLQWRLVPGRDASAGDVLANALGGALGALAAGHRLLIARPDRKTAVGLITAWSVVCATAAITTMWLLAPSPVIYRYWSYWAADQRGHEKFSGTIQSVSLYGTEVPDHAKVEPGSMPAAYSRGEVDLRLSIAGPYPVEEPAEVYRLANRLGQRANVSVCGEDVVFRPPLNAARWRFWSPSVRFGGALGNSDAGEATVLRLQARGGVAMLESTTGGRSTSQSINFEASDAWKFVLSDVTVPRALHPALTAAWFLMIFGPLGLWGAVADRPFAGVVGASAVAATAFLVGPAVAGLPSAQGLNWAGAALASLAGWAVGRFLRGRRTER